MFFDLNLFDSIQKEFGKEYDFLEINDKKIYYFISKDRFSRCYIELFPLGLYFSYSNIEVGEIKELIKYFHIKYKNFSSIQINLNPLDLMKEDFKFFLANYKQNLNYTHILFLNHGYQTYYKNLNATKRNEINRPIDKKLNFMESNSLESFAEYYNIYFDSAKRWGLENTPHSKEFIINLHQCQNVKLYYTDFDGKMISGMIVFYNLKTKQAFYWHGATLVDTNYKKLFSVVKLMDYVVHELIKNNFQSLDLGSSDGLEGVCKFKEGFGGVKTPRISYIKKSWNFRLKKYLNIF